MSKKKVNEGNSESQKGKRTYLKQTDVPMASLDEALRVVEAIFDQYGGNSVTPLQLAKALQLDPQGSQLKVLTGAAIAYGLIDGGAQATTISATELSQNILRPKKENADIEAKREAILKPRIFGEFLQQYDNHPFPRNDIAINVLEEMGVPRTKAEEVLTRIDESARSVGFIEEIKDKKYVTLQRSSTPNIGTDLNNNTDQKDEEVTPPLQERKKVQPPAHQSKSSEFRTAIADDQRRKRVFISHGKSREIIDPIKRLLEYGELEVIVSVNKSSVSKPVPEKVMDDMRSAGAAIIHVDAEETIIDKEDNSHVLLNPNVLIEIGAAMAFYGKRFILLVKEGIKLPSNLQGLFEVRYSGETLDANASISLLEAIRDIKNYSLPNNIEGVDE